MLLELPAGRPDRRQRQRHPGLARRAAALAEVARRAGGDDVLPRRAPALRARDDVVERQLAAMPAILAGEAVAQEQVEARERRMLRGPDILAQRDHRRQLHRPVRAAHLALIMVDDVDALEEHRLDRGLPRPQAERVVAERLEIRVQHERRAAVGMSDQIGVIHGTGNRLRFVAEARTPIPFPSHAGRQARPAAPPSSRSIARGT